MQEVRLEELSDRANYQHDYYESTTKAKYLASYKSYESYVKYTDVKKTLTKLKKEIGEMNYNAVIEKIAILDIVKIHTSVEREG